MLKAVTLPPCAEGSSMTEDRFDDDERLIIRYWPLHRQFHHFICIPMTAGRCRACCCSTSSLDEATDTGEGAKLNDLLSSSIRPCARSNQAFGWITAVSVRRLVHRGVAGVATT